MLFLTPLPKVTFASAASARLLAIIAMREPPALQPRRLTQILMLRTKLREVSLVKRVMLVVVSSRLRPTLRLIERPSTSSVYT